MKPATRTLISYMDVRAVLSDSSFVVPSAPDGDASGGIGWLRASVARFSDGEPHQRRRRLAIDNLSKVDVAVLGEQAFKRTCKVLRSAQGKLIDLMADVARAVPLPLLADGLALPDVPVHALADVARAYHPQNEALPAADRAVSQLVDLCGGVADEETAARIGLLVQAYDATAGLVGNAVLAMLRSKLNDQVAEILSETLRHDPPVRVTRRLATTGVRMKTAELSPGTIVNLDLAAASRDPDVFLNPDHFDPARVNPERYLTFGAGSHACPGRDHAMAIATGILEAVRAWRGQLVDDEIEYEPSANLRVPARLMVRAS